MPLSLFLDAFHFQALAFDGHVLMDDADAAHTLTPMAMADSVTVSMAAESRGMRNSMEGVSQVEMSTASGVTSE